MLHNFGIIEIMHEGQNARSVSAPQESELYRTFRGAGCAISSGALFCLDLYPGLLNMLYMTYPDIYCIHITREQSGAYGSTWPHF